MKKSQLKELIREILAEVASGGLSGFKKAPDEKDNTQMSADDKSITSTAEPTEKEESKKLPVVKKPATPQIVKEDILEMIKEAVDEYRTKGALGATNAARTAPLKKYVPKGMNGMGRPKKDVGSIITVTVNGEPVGEFDLDLKTPSGKSDMAPGAMKRHVQQFYDENQLQEFGFISQEMIDGFEKLSDQWVDGALADNATLDLVIEPGQGGEQVLKPKA